VFLVIYQNGALAPHPPAEMAMVRLQNNTCTDRQKIARPSFLPLPVVGNIERVQPQKLKKAPESFDVNKGEPLEINKRMKKDEEIFLALEESCIFVWFIFHS
jgi:hypothetical protein